VTPESILSWTLSDFGLRSSQSPIVEQAIPVKGIGSRDVHEYDGPVVRGEYGYSSIEESNAFVEADKVAYVILLSSRTLIQSDLATYRRLGAI
jgi:hypothetical protein